MESIFGVKLEKKEKIVAENAAHNETLVLDGHVFDLEVLQGVGTVVATSRASRPELYRAAVDRGEHPNYIEYYTYIRDLNNDNSAVWNSLEELSQAIEHGNYIIG